MYQIMTRDYKCEECKYKCIPSYETVAHKKTWHGTHLILRYSILPPSEVQTEVTHPHPHSLLCGERGGEPGMGEDGEWLCSIEWLVTLVSGQVWSCLLYRVVSNTCEWSGVVMPPV